MEYGINLEKMPAILREKYEVMDALAWNLLFMKYVKDCLPAGLYEQDLYPLVNKPFEEIDPAVVHLSMITSSITASEYVLKEYPILVLEPVLENLIEDTTPDFHDLKLPYPAFFIDKKFKLKKGMLMGVYATEMMQVAYQKVRKFTSSEEEANRKIEEFHKMLGWDPNESHMFFMSIYVSPDEITVIQTNLSEAMSGFKDRKHKTIAEARQRAVFYAANTANLITANVDLENPLNPKKEVRITPYYPGGKPHPKKGEAKKQSPFSIIRIFGNMKQYAEDYGKEKKKRSRASPSESFIVRGHWRHLRADRYRVKKAIWIMPYVKGMDMTLHSKLVKLTE